MDAILHSALLAIGSLLATAVLGLVAQVMKKNGIEMTAAQSDYLSKIVHEGINYAEEYVAKGKGAPNAPTDKLALATSYIAAKRPDLTPAEISDAVHAHLPDSAASGATYDPTKSAAS